MIVSLSSGLFVDTQPDMENICIAVAAVEKVIEMRYYYLSVYLWSCVSLLLLPPLRCVATPPVFLGPVWVGPVWAFLMPCCWAATYRLQGVTQCVLTFPVSTHSYGCQCLGIVTFNVSARRCW